MALQVRTFTDQFLNDLEVPLDSVRSRYEYVLRGFSASIPEEIKSRIEKDSRVREVVQDSRGPVVRGFPATDSRSDDESKLSASSSQQQQVPWGIQRIGGAIDGTGLTAWVLDSGVDLSHDDLNVDVIRSASFVANESADDLNGHGTHVAGILTAIDNNIDVVGIAAGATVVSVKVIDQTLDGTIEAGISGVEYVATNATVDDVINMSLCYHEVPFPDNRHLIDQAVENAADIGLRFAIAAGNEADDGEVCSPGRVVHNNTWTMSAMDSNDTFWVNSNHGNPPINFAAPGVDILSLARNGGTATMTGTSMAAPHVAGLLLASLAGIDTDGTVSNDPAPPADPIAVKADSDVGVFISGPSFVTNGFQGNWEASVSDGFPPYSYQWYRNDEGQPPFWQQVGTGTSYSTTVTSSFELRVDVTDESETTVSSAVHPVSTN